MDNSLRFIAAKNTSRLPGNNDLWWIFKDDQVLVKNIADHPFVPCTSDISEIKSMLTDDFYLGAFDGINCHCAKAAGLATIPDGYEFVRLRPLQYGISEELYGVGARGLHLLHWKSTHRFCGRCGKEMHQHEKEFALECPACGMLAFPRISPAIIVAVLRDNKILLAKNNKTKFDFYSVLAGFVEPGETFEQCVVREVFEEVGLTVDNIRYFASQPWPFPDTLMVGFIADCKSGEIKVDGEEIGFADWFSKGNMPKVPPTKSISRKLIDWFVEN